MSNLFSRLTKLFNPKSLGLLKQDTSVLGLDIGSSSIKAVQLKLDKGVVVLETYGEIALGPYAEKSIGQSVSIDPEQVIKAANDLFREANISTKNSVVGLPLRSSFLRVIELPVIKGSELEKVIPNEARKYIPVPIGEVDLDWWVIPNQELPSHGEEEEDGDRREVLLVAVHKEIISKFDEIVKGLSLSPANFEVETFASIRATTDRDVAPVALLDMGASTTKLTIVDYGVVKVSHTINKGSQDVTSSLATSLNISFEEAEKRKRKLGLGSNKDDIDDPNPLGANEGGTVVASSAVEHALRESNKVILDFQRRYNRLVSKVILTGGGSLLKGFIPLAEKNFDANVIVADPFEKTKAPEFLEDILEEAGPEFSVAVGLALRGLQELE